MKYKKKILIIATNFCRHSKELPIKRKIIEELAGSGISYRDLKNVFEKFIAKGLAGVLSLPPSLKTSKATRVAKKPVLQPRRLQDKRHFHKYYNVADRECSQSVERSISKGVLTQSD